MFVSSCYSNDKNKNNNNNDDDDDDDTHNVKNSIIDKIRFTPRVQGADARRPLSARRRAALFS
jgi:hypothetical protein